MPEQFICVNKECGKRVTATANKRYRSHYRPDGEKCELSSTEIPPRELEAGPLKEGADPGVPEEGRDFAVCECGRKVKLTRLGYFEPHDKTLRGGDRCPNSGTRHKFPALKKTDTLALPSAPPEDKTVEPVDAKPVKGRKSDSGYALDVKIKRKADEAPPEDRSDLPEPARTNLFRQPMPVQDADSGASTESSSPESSTTSKGSPEHETAPEEGFSLGTRFSESYRQPGSPFLQPPPYEGPPPVLEMSEYAKELATKIKETFYSYSNRKTTDNRGAQTTLGPSEIGTPCDRRLAMELLGIRPVNPGGDGWASFVGTQGHEGMAKVYAFADAGTGRYVVEMPVFLGIPTVPKGTTDLLDRRDGTIIDWKFMGSYSLNKFRREGVSETYRIQAQVYGYGAEKAGEKVRQVAVVGLPRAGSSLDEMYVHVEKYDKKTALLALDRVERIAKEVDAQGCQDHDDRMSAARIFDTGDDCRFCPFFLKTDKEMTKGCPGK